MFSFNTLLKLYNLYLLLYFKLIGFSSQFILKAKKIKICYYRKRNTFYQSRERERKERNNKILVQCVLVFLFFFVLVNSLLIIAVFEMNVYLMLISIRN